MTGTNARVADVKKILPHRPPFLFVDRVIEWQAQQFIRTELTLSPEMDFFKGHFPQRPVMPGVLVTEALAQTAGLLLGLAWQDLVHKEASDGESIKRELFLAADQMKYMHPAVPGDRLQMEARLKKTFGKLHQFDVTARCAARTIARGVLTLAEIHP